MKDYKNILSSLPIISGLLIFLGFLNYTFYYRHFDINISKNKLVLIKPIPNKGFTVLQKVGVPPPQYLA